jgi:hypothetical protein
MVAYQATGSAVFRGFAWLLFAATAGMVAIVSWRTAAHALRGEICVEEK